MAQSAQFLSSTGQVFGEREMVPVQVLRFSSGCALIGVPFRSVSCSIALACLSVSTLTRRDLSSLVLNETFPT